MKYFIANWKAHKNVYQVVEWLTVFSQNLKQDQRLIDELKTNRACIILCPSLPFLFYVKQYIKDLPNTFTGIQDISQFEEGSYTGEVAAPMLKGIVDYAIVGHSERRNYFKEDENMLSKKMDHLNTNSIKSILCIRNENDIIYDSATMVAYEPVGAIGSGKNMDVHEVIEMKKKLKLNPEKPFLYGGSVNSGDCKEYIESESIDGFLVGTASLDATEFIKLLQNSL